MSHAWELLAHASARHEITLLCLEHELDQVAPALRELGVAVRGVSWERHRPPGRAALLWEALRGPGSEHFRSLAPGVQRAGSLIEDEQERHDLLFLWGGELAQLLAKARIPTAHYLTDAHTTYHRRLIRSAPSPRHRLLYTLDAVHVRRWERTRYRAATALATTSAAEAVVLERLTGRPPEIVPLAVGEEWFVAPGLARERDLVTIVAGLDYWPNIDGIGWFVREGWPKIRAVLPDARLRVVGRSPVPELRALLASAGVELLADVPDARPHYWSAAVAVMPLRVGSGVKNKLIHAFACGAPVVATSVAVEGVAALDGEHALIAEDSAGLAAAVIDVLRRPAQAAQRARAARELCEPYRAQRAAQALERFWQRAVGQRADPPGDASVKLGEQLKVSGGAGAPGEDA
jgi:glycosyltransferase involved in cell wall biosynthesis